MSELAFLGIILGANAGLIAFAAWIVGDERAEAYAWLAALTRDTTRSNSTAAHARPLS